MANNLSDIKDTNILKPCPFCGSENLDFIDSKVPITDTGSLEIDCLSCPATMTVHYFLGNYSRGDRPKMFKELVNAWNKRKYEIHRKSAKGSSNPKETGPS